MALGNYTFYVRGMHCRSCVLLIESEISALPNITEAKCDLNVATLAVSGDFSGKSPEDAAKELSAAVSTHGYEILAEKPKEEKRVREFVFAIPLALIFASVFFFLQKLGLVNFVDASVLSYKTVFLIGVVASLSSCMAVVGGLLLSFSAECAKENKKFVPAALFHSGRMLSFFFLGGVLGAAGAVFRFNENVSLLLGILVSLVMFFLGIDLLGIFRFHKKFLPTVPKKLSKKALSLSAPFLLGAATFFLPCGFTQSMQFYALSTGNFWSGAATMLVFSLGTFPALFAISLGSWSIGKSENSGIFFKTAGIIVILFSVFNLINGLAALGIMRPIFRF